MNKKCSRCKKEKPIKGFYRNRSTKDGRDSYCMKCKRDYMLNNKRPVTPEMRHKYYLENKERILAQHKEYRETDKERKFAAAAAKRHSRKYPDKIKARSISFVAITNGKLKRPETCSKCPSNKEIQAHHPDYRKPLDVIWLCRICHMEHHRLERIKKENQGSIK